MIDPSLSSVPSVPASEEDAPYAEDVPAETAGMLDHSPQRFLNRELSLMAFNGRVLEEAHNPNHPIFERVRFVSIAERNLDEFFMIRVAGITGQIRENVSHRSIDGLSPQQQLDEIRGKTRIFTAALQESWNSLRAELEQHDIRILSIADLPAAERGWLAEHFDTEVFPVLSPIAVDPSHPFPLLPNRGIALALLVHDKEAKKTFEALIRIPSQLKRLIALPARDSSAEGDQLQEGVFSEHYVLLEQLILANIEKLFPKPLEIKDHAVFKLLRDSELEIEEEAEDLVLTFESALKRRQKGNVIQLFVQEGVGEGLIEFLAGQLSVTPPDIAVIQGMLGLSDLDGLITDRHGDFLFPPFDARFPERIRDFGGDCFAAIQHKDILVHHPYESFDVVVQFLKQAARDPDVVAIKQTLYRTSVDSPIADALMEAAYAGKSVTALVELKARFDEEANIRWARNLERAGVQVVYGFRDLKTHTKLSLVLRREGGRLRHYIHIGTGNYNPHTAKIYTDLSFFTCDSALCADAAALFNYMTGYTKPVAFNALYAAPLNLRETMMSLIDSEIAFAREGKPASIWFKCNAVLDSVIVDKLYEASQAGVKIDLIVRGICSLRPGVPGLSENIRVKSIIGRFLEHSRIYCFGNGEKMPSRKSRVFISSADMMKRNLTRRVEVLVPIENKTVHKQILDQIMVALLKDRKQSWIMQPDGTYIRYPHTADAFSAHEYFMKNPSLSGRGKALKAMPMPPPLTLDESLDEIRNETLDEESPRA